MEDNQKSSLLEVFEQENQELNNNNNDKLNKKEKHKHKHGHSHGDGHGHSHGDGHGHSHGDEKKEDGSSGSSHGHSHSGGHGHSHGLNNERARSSDSIDSLNNNSNNDHHHQDHDHDDHDDHDHHGHSHSPGPARGLLSGEDTSAELAKKRKARYALSICLVLTTIFMVGEVVGGYIANSLAVMTDAAHLLTDIGAMLLSLFAMWISTHPPTSSLSFGFHRAEILGALASVLMIWALTGVLIYEAIQRVLHPPDSVDGKVMFIIACCGLFINIIDAIILHYGAGGHGHSHGGGGHSHGGGGGHSHAKKKKQTTEEIDIELGSTSKPKKEEMNINVYSAYIHVIGDCFQSIGVMIAAAIIWIKPEWKIADPITTFIFSIIVLFTTIRLLKQSLGVLMEGVPSEISVTDVQSDLSDLPGVTEVHDLHIWSITIGKPALSVHLTIGDGVNADETLKAANRLLKDTHNIEHTTIQIELPAKEDSIAICKDPCPPPRYAKK